MKPERWIAEVDWGDGRGWVEAPKAFGSEREAREHLKTYGIRFGPRGARVVPLYRPADIGVTEEEIELLREQANSVIRSFQQRGVPDHKQSTEWHEGQKLMRLVEKLQAAPKPEVATP